MDDHSSDATLEILKQEEGNGLRVIARERNGGIPVARNVGIDHANGEFVAFIDHDDEWLPDKLQLQIELISTDHEMVMVGCHAEEWTIKGNHVLVNADRSVPTGTNAWRALLHHSFFVPSTILVRTAAAREISGFNEALVSGEDDQDFLIRMALHGKVGFVDKVLTVMHQQPTSFSKECMSREHVTTLPMISAHCAALQDRLTRSELREILGARYTQIGRNVYVGHPTAGARLLIRAILKGSEPLKNTWYLITASPFARWIKGCLLNAPART